MIPRPPRPALFPYTTLFRSSRLQGAERDGHAAGRAGREERTEAGRVARVDDERRGRFAGDDGAQRARRPLPGVGDEDRKSTRLNSSHLGISYAVFCLKKKKR